MNKVLVIRFGRIGDMVMITPALRAILEKHADAEVHLLTGPNVHYVLQGFDPRVTAFHLYDRKGLLEAFRRRGLRRAITAGNYTHIYCLETNPSFHRLLSRMPTEKYLLSHSDKVVPFPERCLDLVGQRPASSTWVSLPVTDKGRAAAGALLDAYGITEADFFIGLHLTFSALNKARFRGREARRRKTWPIQSFARVAALLSEYGARRGIKVKVATVLLPEFRKLGLELVGQSGGLVTLIAEAPDFERYKGLLARMNLFITPDTGPMHVAAALGTPLVGLFCGADPRDCGPYTDPSRYVVLRAEEAEQPELGLTALSPDLVFAAATTFLPSSSYRQDAQFPLPYVTKRATP